MYFDLSGYQFPFFVQISPSKQIVRNLFCLNYEADSDRTVFRVLQKNPKCNDTDPLFVFVVGAATVDVGSRKLEGTLRPQRRRMFR